MKELAKQVKKSETKKEVVLEIHLKDEEKIKDFILPFIEMNRMSTDPFYSLDVKIWIDKQSMQLKKVEEKKKYKTVFTNREHMTITVFTGQIKQVTVPEDLKNATK